MSDPEIIKKFYAHQAAEEERQAQAQAQAEAAARRAKTERVIQQIQPYIENQAKGETTMLEDNQYEDILARHAAAARAEIEREAAKSAEQKAYEKAVSEHETLAQQYAALAKDTSRNKPALDQISPRLKQLSQEIEVAEIRQRTEFNERMTADREAAIEAQRIEKNARGPVGQSFVPRTGRG
jgi:colicin import membrane protein